MPAAFFRIRSGEVERVLLMLAFSLLAVGGIVITGQLLGRSLFLSSVPATAIPLRFIAPPLALVATIALYTRLAQRIRSARLSGLTLGAILAGVVVARWLLTTPARESLGFLLGLFTFFEIASALTMILFWTLAADLFTSREAKRLFPLIAGGSALSNVGFGAFLVRGATAVQPENLIWIIAVSVVLCLAIVLRLVSRYPTKEIDAGVAGEAAESTGWIDGLRGVFASPLTLVIGSIVVVVALVSNITDYQLDLALKLNYSEDTQAMVRLLALLRLFSGVVAVVLQFFVVSWLMERFGILPALLLLPVAIAGGSAAILATGGALWAVAIPRTADFSLKYTVNDSAFNLLYLPLPPAFRARAKAIVDGMVKPLLVSLLGLAFLGIARLDGVRLVYWAIPVLILSAVWVALLIRGSREYVRALSHSLLMRRLDLGEATLDLSDETSNKVLEAALDQPDSLRIVHTISLLREATDADWSDRIARLIDHPAAEVRSAVVAHLGQRSDRRHADAVRPRLSDPDPGVRCDAIAAYGRLLGDAAVRDLVPLLEDDDRTVRGATIVALILHGGLSGFLHAGRPLHELLEHPDAAGRAQGAELLGELGVQSFYGPLLELMGDPETSVRLAAVRAAERVAAPELLQGLVAALDDPALRRSAIRAICASASGDGERSAALLHDPAIPYEVAVALIESSVAPHVDGLLSGLLDDDREPVRAAVYATLLRRRADGQRPQVDGNRLQACLERELRVAFERLLFVEDLQPEASSLLAEALDQRTRADQDRVLAVLALTCPDLLIDDVREALRHPDARLKANAIELLDNVVATGKQTLIPFVAGSVAEKIDVAERRLGLKRQPRMHRLGSLIEDNDAWLASCAIAAADATELSRLEAVVRRALTSSSDRVRDTASHALEKLQRSEDPDKLEGPFRGDQEGFPMALAPLERVLFLKQVPLFREIPGEQVASILPTVDEVSFQTGDTIIRQGDTGDALYMIVEGQVGIEIDGRSIDKVLGSRDVIGELAILTGDVRGATCKALSEVLALRISHDPFWRLMRERPEITLGVMQIVLGYLKNEKR